MSSKIVQIGTTAEHYFFYMLLSKNYTVYTPLVDDAGVDCLIDTYEGIKKIQIKSINSTRNGRGGIRFGNTGFIADFVFIKYHNKDFIIPGYIFTANDAYFIPYNGKSSKYIKYLNNWDILPKPIILTKN